MRLGAGILAVVLAASLTACGGGGDDDADDDAPAGSAAASGASSAVAVDAALADRCGDDVPAGFANVDLTTSDGVHLVGALAGSGTTGIVLAHQRNGDGCGWLDYGARLAGYGMVLAPGLRGFGGSDEGQGDGETRYDLDVVAAAEELKRRGATRIVLMGASIGGTSVILAAPELDAAPAAVIALSPPEDLDGRSAADAFADATWTTTIVAAEDDPQYEESSRALAEAGGDRVKLVTYAKGGHGWNLLTDGAPEHADLDGRVKALVTG
jgi:dienelactone hydrolase